MKTMYSFFHTKGELQAQGPPKYLHTVLRFDEGHAKPHENNLRVTQRNI